MKRFFRLGGVVALLMAFFLSAELFFPEKVDYLFELLKFPIKNELFLILNIIFLYALKKHANFRYYVHSEELKFIFLYLILILNQIVVYLIPSNFNDGLVEIVVVLGIIFLLGLTRYILEYNIYDILAKRVKDSSYQFCMFLFRLTLIFRIFELFRDIVFIILDIFAINIPYQGRILSYSLYFVQVSNVLLILSYFVIAIIFLKPKETYSF